MKDSKDKNFKETCYMCTKLATTREHVPPKVFFPEEKDMSINCSDFRSNLITIPSCKEHNLSKSWNDEYGFMIIVASLDVNKIAQEHFGKVVRALHYRPQKGRVYLKDFVPIMVDGKPTIAPKIQIERFSILLEQISRGLYFHQFHEKWNKKIKVLPLSIYRSPEYDGNREINENILSLRKTSQDLFHYEPKYGAHPEIFYYQFKQDSEFDRFFLRMVFYEGFEVLTIEEDISS